MTLTQGHLDTFNITSRKTSLFESIETVGVLIQFGKDLNVCIISFQCNLVKLNKHNIVVGGSIISKFWVTIRPTYDKIACEYFKNALFHF